MNGIGPDTNTWEDSVVKFIFLLQEESNPEKISKIFY